MTAATFLRFDPDGFPAAIVSAPHIASNFCPPPGYFLLKICLCIVVFGSLNSSTMIFVAVCFLNMVSRTYLCMILAIIFYCLNSSMMVQFPHLGKFLCIITSVTLVDPSFICCMFSTAVSFNLFIIASVFGICKMTRGLIAQSAICRKHLRVNRREVPVTFLMPPPHTDELLLHCQTKLLISSLYPQPTSLVTFQLLPLLHPSLPC